MFYIIALRHLQICNVKQSFWKDPHVCFIKVKCSASVEKHTRSPHILASQAYGTSNLLQNHKPLQIGTIWHQQLQISPFTSSSSTASRPIYHRRGGVTVLFEHKVCLPDSDGPIFRA
jgi:hypothetical protein